MVEDLEKKDFEENERSFLRKRCWARHVTQSFLLATKRLNYALNNIVSTLGPIIDSSPYCGRFHYAAQIPDPF